MMPLKLKLSQSRLNAYDDCERKYYYRYILVFYGEQITSPAMEFGLLVHKMIQRINDSTEENKVDEVSNIIYQTIADHEEYEERLIKLIKPLISLVKEYNVIISEEWIEIKMFEDDELDEAMVASILKTFERKGKEGVFDGVYFGGYVDAYATDSEGKKTVIDWKSGKYTRKWSGGYIRQTQLYTQVERMLGKEVDKGKMIYVEQNYENEADVSEKTCQDVYDKAKATFLEILKKKDDIKQFPMIGDPAICNHCEYDLICNL